MYQVDPKEGPGGLEIAASRTPYNMPVFSTVAGTRDGDRFLAAGPPESQRVSRVGVITNWASGLSK